MLSFQNIVNQSINFTSSVQKHFNDTMRLILWKGVMQSASAPLLTESAFPIRCLTGAVVKTEREETTTASFAFAFQQSCSPQPRF